MVSFLCPAISLLLGLTRLRGCRATGGLVRAMVKSSLSQYKETPLPPLVESAREKVLHFLFYLQIKNIDTLEQYRIPLY